jgi:hypothetical protein
MIARLKRAADAKGLTIIDHGNGHFQISGGPLLVNYYPLAKRQSAYIAGTTKKRTFVTPEEAVEMAFSEPERVGQESKAKRGRQRQHRLKLLAKHPYCRWCGTKLTEETATIEHIIPLDRGGLDNLNNKALACAECNHKRANNMPELEKQQA